MVQENIDGLSKVESLMDRNLKKYSVINIFLELMKLIANVTLFSCKMELTFNVFEIIFYSF